MFRLLLTIFLVITASVLYGYLQELNPGTVALRLSPADVFELSPVTLVLIAMATGALAVALMVGVRETRHLIVNWRATRLRRREERIETLYRDGTHAFLSKRTAEALGLFEKALSLDPNHIESLLWLGNLYRAEDNLTEAIRLHRKARGINERNVEVLLALAQDLEEAKRFEEALQTLNDILRLDPGHLTALIRKRDLFVRLEQWHEALEVQQRLLRATLSPQDQKEETALLVGLTYEVGRQCLERGVTDKARHAFRAAIKRDKGFLPAYVGLCEVLIREGKAKQAAEILEKVYAKTGNVILLHRLEELYLDLGEPGEILRVYQEAVQRDDRNPVLRFYLGKLYYRLEMVDEAFDLLATLEGPHEQMADYHKIMANLYLRKQQMDAAVDELKKALGFKKRVVVPYRCTHCQAESAGWAGRCRQCGRWNSLVALPWVDPSQTTEAGGLRLPGRAGSRDRLSSPFETV